jgi:hypothetical protein
MKKPSEQIAETTEPTTTPKLSKAETEFNIAMNEIRQRASASDVAMAAALGKTGSGIRRELISSAAASVVFCDHNKRNRNVSLSKVMLQRDAMNRGEWKLHHQGIAFYPDGTLADGQHRMAALALSQAAPLSFVVSSDFDKDAIDAIDRSARRTAGEALQMLGIEDGKAKATMARTVMEYIYEEQNGRRPSFTDPQVEKWVLDQEDTLSKALNVGRKSVENVSDPCLGQAEAATFACLMLIGGWGDQATVSYIASIQQGVATYPESPTVALSKLYLRAKINARRTDRLSKKAKIALALKGAALWVEEKSVARMTWNASKESLPTHQRPLGI